jgi:hypothetical protein
MYRFLLLLLLAASFGSAQIPTAGLMGYWPMDNDANDYSGNGNHGTVYNATLTCDRCGNPNRAYGFNGINASIIVNNSPTIDTDNFTDFSVAFWMKVPSNPNNNALPLSKNQWGSWSGYQFFSNNTMDPGYCTTPGQLSFYTASGGMQDACANGPVSQGPPAGSIESCEDNWYFITGVYDAASNQNYIYINSVLQADVGGRSGNLSNTVNLVFGAHPNNVWFFKGILDDIRIYKAKLSQADINALYAESCNSTSVSEFSSDSDAEVFPNPSAGIFTIKINKPIENGELILFNSLGQKVYEQKISQLSNDIDITHLSPGLYNYSIIGNRTTAKGKVMIQ